MRHGNLTTPIPATNRLNWGVTNPSKNALLNGDFEIAQRGTSFNLATNNLYTLDRWANSVVPDGGTAASGTITQQSFALGQTAVPWEPQCFIRVNNTSTGTTLGLNSYHVIEQRIEGVRTFAGQTITISFWAQSSIASKKISIELAQNFGTGGTPSTFVSAARSAFTLSSNWQKYTATLTLPSIVGKTLGTNKNDSLAFKFYLQAGSGLDSVTGQTGGLPWGSTGTTDFALTQVEIGQIGTEFEQRPLNLEFLLCQRYCQIIFVTARFLSTAANQVTSAPLFWIPMRVAPVATLITAGSRSTNLSSALLQDINFNGGRYDVKSSASGDTYALADKYLLDAEI